MFARSSRLLAASLGLGLAAGCLYPVGEKVDHVVCDLSARPRDLGEAIPVELPPAMPPAQVAGPADSQITPAAYQKRLLPGRQRWQCRPPSSHRPNVVARTQLNCPCSLWRTFPTCAT